MSRRVLRNGVRAKYRDSHDMHLDTEDTEVSPEEFDMVRSQVFSFHSM